MASLETSWDQWGDASACWPIGAFFSTAILSQAEESGDHKPEIKGENGVISLKVKDQHGGEVVFKVKR